jgi:hypothetical protein
MYIVKDDIGQQRRAMREDEMADSRHDKAAYFNSSANRDYSSVLASVTGDGCSR